MNFLDGAILLLKPFTVKEDSEYDYKQAIIVLLSYLRVYLDGIWNNRVSKWFEFTTLVLFHEKICV